MQKMTSILKRKGKIVLKESAIIILDLKITKLIGGFMMNEVSQKMPLLEKISYGAGNMGICLSTTVITTFAMFFYTNVIGINI